MKNSLMKSILAVLAGFALGAILSIATDKILEAAGILITEPFSANPAWLIGVIITYRSVFNAAGAYLTARLAPHKPIKHALILGFIGFAFSIFGTIMMWHIPPHWYPITLIVLTLPAAWLGGKIALSKINSLSKNK